MSAIEIYGVFAGERLLAKLLFVPEKLVRLANTITNVSKLKENCRRNGLVEIANEYDLLNSKDKVMYSPYIWVCLMKRTLILSH